MKDSIRSNQPHQYPLRGCNPGHDIQMVCSGSKTKLNYTYKDYEESIHSNMEHNSREGRKRIRNSADMKVMDSGAEGEANGTWEDVSMSDGESSISAQSTSQDLPNGRPSCLQRAPKRRLTSVGLNCNTPLSVSCDPSSTRDLVQVNQVSERPSNNNARLVGSINSPPSSSILDVEEQSQQLSLPSPSASPVQSTNDDLHVLDTLHLSSSDFPATEQEMLDMLVNLSFSMHEKNRNYLIFRLLQNVKRSYLSSFYNLIGSSLKRDLLSNLPLEISYQILKCLDYRSICSISKVSRRWNKIIANSGIWIELLKKDKLMDSDHSIQKELANPEKLIREWSTTRNDEIDLPQLLYKKRMTILKRWMDPNYKPKRISVFGHGSNVVTCMQHDDEKIITGFEEKFINIYSTKTGELLKVLEGHEGGVWALKYTGNTLVTGSVDRTVRVWNLKTGKCTHIFKGHTSTVRCLDILHPVKVGKNDQGEDIIFPKEPLLVTGSRDHNLRVWKLPIISDDHDDSDSEPEIYDSNDSENPYLVAILTGHTQSVRSVCGYGNIIISGSYDTTVRVWDLLNEGRCRHVLADHADKIYPIALDFQNRKCYSGSMDSLINVWDIETGKMIRCLEGHSSLVGLLELSEDYLVSASADATLVVWDKDTGENIYRLKGHGGPITCFQQDLHRIVSGSEKMLKLWNIKTGKFVRDLLTDIIGGTWQVRFDADKCIAAVQRNNDDIVETFIEILDFSEPLNAITN